MKRAAAAILLTVCILASVTLAQPQQQPPKPGPEHKWMDDFVGRWIGEGEVKASPFGPAGKSASTEDVEWAPGGFFLVMHWEWKGPEGEVKGLTVMGYNAQKKVYFSRSFDFTKGGAWGFEGPVEGDTWTATSPEFKRDGKLLQTRYVMKILSPTSSSSKQEYSTEGGPWITYMEGKGTKMKAGPGGLPLRGYKFDVVTVNSSGTVTNRRKGQARYYVEDISGVALEMVEIPGGTFLMGNTEAGADQAKREYERHGHNAEVASQQSRWEVPQHTVSVPTFYMGKFEVTQAQWRAVCELPKVNKDLVCDDRGRVESALRADYLPHIFKGDSLPVQQVSWEDAIEFCERLSRATGRSYRLPTEAEWEYAARGGTTTAFHFGDTITPELVNYDGNYPYGSAPKGTNRQTTTPVGSLGYPNAFGLYDMHGNVWEWCMDFWHESYDGAPTDGSSWETAGETRRRVLRSGSYYHDGNHCRAAMRVGVLAASGSPSTGFRLVAVAQTR